MENEFCNLLSKLRFLVLGGSFRPLNMASYCDLLLASKLQSLKKLKIQ